MDHIVTDSERAERSGLYGLAYDLARAQINQLGRGDQASGTAPADSDSIMRRLIAIVGRELGDDGAARRVIGWAAEDAVAGWGPRTTIRLSPKLVVEPWTHGGATITSGEGRGRLELSAATRWPPGEDVMVVDARSEESPRGSMNRRFEQLMRSRPQAGSAGVRVEPFTMPTLFIRENDPKMGGDPV
jgi:hypothetical protein